MKLYLVQHGEAHPEEVDPARSLTEKGKGDVFRVAQFLKKNVKVDAIWHSTKTRAIQTAQILAQALTPKKGTVEKEGLAPNDYPGDELKKEILGEENLMIVSHLPFLQRLITFLLLSGLDPGLIFFRQGGVVCLESEDKATWRLRWAIAPELLK